MLIDFHTHVFPEKIASRAIAQLAERAKMEPVTDGTVQGLLDKMDLWQVDRAVVCNIATNVKQQTSVNDFALQIMRDHGDRLIPLCSVHPDADTIEAEIERVNAAGVPGLKLHPDYMLHAFDEPVYGPILDTAAQLGMFVIIHAGFDVYSPDRIYATADGILAVLERHPKLKLICAHYGNNYLWDTAETKLAGRNLWIDTSMGCREGLFPSQAKRILEKHDSDKILFGSDCPWCDVRENTAYIESLGLSSCLLDKIFYKNAQALLDGSV
ncbi:MAG: amidohydrolase family protein [Clostridia bacterium]|nr:amidohydrolase family protein [Clostridia bacterium]